MRIRLRLAAANLAALTLMSGPGTLDSQLGVLLAGHAFYRLEADLKWIDNAAARLDLPRRAVPR